MSTQPTTPEPIDDTPHPAPVDDAHPFHDDYLRAFIEAHQVNA